MNLAILTLSYREDAFIEAVIKNWKGKVRRHLILEGNTPWHGPDLPKDRTEEICHKYPHCDYISLDWKSEAMQRNWGLGRLYDYDYVLIVDSDELYTEEDQKKILDELGKEKDFQDNTYCYRIANVKTYFKTADYCLEPRDTHKPCFAVNPRKITFKEVRLPSTDYQIPIDVTMHHLSYLRNDKRIKNKILQFEHYDIVKPNWYEEVWSKWTPEMPDVRAFGIENSKCIVDPLPQELKDLLTKGDM